MVLCIQKIPKDAVISGDKVRQFGFDKGTFMFEQIVAVQVCRGSTKWFKVALCRLPEGKLPTLPPCRSSTQFHCS